MLESVSIASAPCLGEGPAVIAPLKQVTFIFGANGSGKTTISRALGDPSSYGGVTYDWSHGSTPLATRVYNRDYVNATIAQANSLPGVFLLGGESQAVRDELEQLTGPGGLLEQLERELTAQVSTLGDAEAGTGILGRLNEAKVALTDAAWAKRESIPDALRPMFTGYNNSKAQFASKLLSVADACDTTDTDLDSLVAEAASVFDASAAEAEELPTLVEPDAEHAKGFELLAAPIVGAADVGLADLIEQLGNSDWVAQGRHYLKHSDGHCPFCQEVVPEGLERQLEEYFDARFADQIAELAQFADWYGARVEALGSTLDALLADPPRQLDVAALSATRATLDAALAANSVGIAAKLERPSSVVKLEPVDDDISRVNQILGLANAAIRVHNARVRNKKEERAALIEKCWRHFVRDTVASEVAVYESAVPGLLKGAESLQTKGIPEAQSKLDAAKGRQSELERQVRSSKIVIDAINATLASVGFETFHLAPAAAPKDGYSLVRHDGSAVAGSLSEGERTFITFLYYFHQLQGAPTSTDEPRGLLAVIDDPICSLDSDVLFVVSALTKRLIADVIAGRGRVRQLLLLTHNVQFHREVTYCRRGEPGAGRQYLLLRKRQGRSSQLVAFADNPVKSAYRVLWDEVRAARDDPMASVVGLQNLLRRILETYFKTMGDVNEDEIIAAFTGSDQVVCRSLFSWINAGSHTIVEDTDYCPSEAGVATWLRVFEAIFDKAGHPGHYEMMMRAVMPADANE